MLGTKLTKKKYVVKNLYCWFGRLNNNRKERKKRRKTYDFVGILI